MWSTFHPILAILIALHVASWNTKIRVIYTCGTSEREHCYGLWNSLLERDEVKFYYIGNDTLVLSYASNVNFLI